MCDPFELVDMGFGYMSYRAHDWEPVVGDGVWTIEYVWVGPLTPGALA